MKIICFPIAPSGTNLLVDFRWDREKGNDVKIFQKQYHELALRDRGDIDVRSSLTTPAGNSTSKESEIKVG